MISPQESEGCSEPLSDSDTEALEIDENFLANGIIGSASISNQDTFNENIGLGSVQIDGLPSPRTFDPRRPISASPLLKYRLDPLAVPSTLDEKLDAECCIFLRTSDLSRIGIFDGDWAVIGDVGHSELRLSRIFARDDLIKSETSQALSSPILLSNVQVSRSDSCFISIRSSLFGSRNPPIPTARAVTVARVASPYSHDRIYQPFFLDALKNYFDDQKRLVKKGDLIAVGLRAELARLAHERNSDAPNSDNKDAKNELLNCELPFMSKVNNAVVFFKVTNLEYDLVDTSKEGSPPDHYMAATMGELGCWIDPQVTKMVQTGLEHSRIPDVTSYLNLVIGSAPLLSSLNLALLDPSSPLAKFRDLAEAALYPAAMDYDLQLSLLLKGSRGIGKFTAASWVAQFIGIHLMEINCFDLIGETDIQTEGTLRARFEKAASCAPCILILRHIDALARTTQALETGKDPSIASALHESISELAEHWKLTGYPVLVVGTTSEPERVPASVLACFKHEIVFEAPTEMERLNILDRLLADVPLAPDVSIKTIATQTAAMVASDLVDLVDLGRAISLKRAKASSCQVTERDVSEAGVMLTSSDLDAALSSARISYSESIGAPKIPTVSWDDVGGLASVKSDILDTIQLPLEHPELFADGLKKRSGILLYGPPGTGKTLLAKAVATSCSLNFFSVKGPELLNMYIGESEANVRRVFQRARDAKPCVIFFDELDSVAPKRGNHGDSGGVMDRIVSQLLAELDGMADGKGGADVFVIGATNRPDLLDPALLRPGRFDRMLYLGVSDTHEAQHHILQALTRKFRRDPDLDLMDIARQCPFNYTGADFYALCSDAMLKAMSRKADEVEMKISELNQRPPPYKHPHPITPQYYLAELATGPEIEVRVSRRDFIDALHELVPSVTQDEMAHYAAVQRRFARDTINSDINQKKRGEVLLSIPTPAHDKGKGKAIA
ncbi:AAA-domain-containing protein [Ramaria rubella]|nr:AAA-domain-containing protein [Ramaria rubella]